MASVWYMVIVVVDAKLRTKFVHCSLTAWLNIVSGNSIKFHEANKTSTNYFGTWDMPKDDICD